MQPVGGVHEPSENSELEDKLLVKKVMLITRTLMSGRSGHDRHDSGTRWTVNSQEPKNEVQGVGHFLGEGLGSPMGRPFMCR